MPPKTPKKSAKKSRVLVSASQMESPNLTSQSITQTPIVKLDPDAVELYSASQTIKIRLNKRAEEKSVRMYLKQLQEEISTLREIIKRKEDEFERSQVELAQKNKDENNVRTIDFTFLTADYPVIEKYQLNIHG